MLKRIPYWHILLAPLLIFALGYTMNATVVAANHGVMPVLYSVCPDKVIDKVHVCFSSNTHLAFLADWLFTVTPEGIGMYSPGDFLILASAMIKIPFLLLWAVLTVQKVNNGKSS